MKKLFILFAIKRLGAPDDTALEALAAVKSEEEIKSLAYRMEKVETWDELFQTDQI